MSGGNVGQNVMEKYLRGQESWLMNKRIEEFVKWMNCRPVARN